MRGVTRREGNGISTSAKRVDPLPGADSNMFIELMGDTRVDASATASPHRDTRFEIGTSSKWAEPKDVEDAMGWTKSIYETTAPPDSAGVHLTCRDRDDGGRRDEARATNRSRLRDIKRKHDPESALHCTVNVGRAG
jgi:hypothetical protein